MQRFLNKRRIKRTLPKNNETPQRFWPQKDLKLRFKRMWRFWWRKRIIRNG